jgi:PH (Pleckstrin Homology) domain-containing protein
VKDFQIGFKSIIPEGQAFEVFKPRKSLWGWFSSVAVVGGLGAGIAVAIGQGSPAGRIVSGLLIALIIPGIFFLCIYPTMKYSIGADTLVLSCGPFKWLIPISSICRIREDDLQYLPKSQGWKLPGYALFRIEYGRIGMVRMCATSLTTRILLISTDTEIWGITPANVDSFKAAIARGRK